MVRHARMFMIRSLAASLLCVPVAYAQDAKQDARPDAKPLAVGDPAPPLSVEAWSQLPDGVDPHAGYDWESLRGTTVVVEFWATWCGPCIAAIPHMNDLAKAFEGEVVFISVTDEPEEKTLALREKRPMESVLGFDTDKSMHKAYQVRAIPKTIVVDKEGKVASITHPNRLTAEKLRGHVEGRHDEPAANGGGGGGAEPWSIGSISSGVDPFDRRHNVPVCQIVFRESIGKGMMRTGKGPTNVTSIDSSPLELITYVFEVQPWQVTMPQGYDDAEGAHYDLIVRLPEETFGDQRKLVQSLVLNGMGMEASVKDVAVTGYVLSREDAPSKLEAADPVEPGGFSVSNYTYESLSTGLDTFARWLQGVLGAPLENGLHDDGRYAIDFSVHAAFDPTDADDVAKLRTRLKDELGLVLEPKENTVPMVTVSRKPGADAN